MASANSSPATRRYASDPPPDQEAAVAPRLKLSPVNLELPVEQRSLEALRLAEEAFAMTGSWVVFYREMLGSDGVCRQLFADVDEMRYFETTPEFAELQEMIAALRSQDDSKGDAAEPTRMITIRLPVSLHDALKTEAKEQNLSINKLCISKLLQRIEARFVPLQKGAVRGRRPGPQESRQSPSEPERESGEESQVMQGRMQIPQHRTD